MTIRFSKRLRLLPGVHLSLSASSASLNVGSPGANVTLGQSPKINLGLPGSGFSTSLPLAGGGQPGQPQPSRIQPLASTPPTPRAPIASQPLDRLTSPALADICNYLLEQRRVTAKRQVDVQQAESALGRQRFWRSVAERDLANVKHADARLAAVWLVPFRRRRRAKLAAFIASHEHRLAEALAGLPTCEAALAEARALQQEATTAINLSLDAAAAADWRALSDIFSAMRRSSRVWDITASRSQRRGTDRSAANLVIERERVTFERIKPREISFDGDTLVLHNANGADLYLLPCFLLAQSKLGDIALIALDDLTVTASYVQYHEDEYFPDDAQEVGTTWARANRDGSRDLRYADNHAIPIALYARLEIASSTGLLESWLLSNADAAIAFAEHWHKIVASIALPDSTADGRK